MVLDIFDFFLRDLLCCAQLSLRRFDKNLHIIIRCKRKRRGRFCQPSQKTWTFNDVKIVLPEKSKENIRYIRRHTDYIQTMFAQNEFRKVSKP